MRIDGLLSGLLTPVLQLNKSESSLLEGLNKGDIIKAQILDLKMGEMILGLADGSTIKAATRVQLQAKPGDIVSFTFAEKVNGKILLETIKPEAIRQEVIQQENIQQENIKPEMISTGKIGSKAEPDPLNQVLKRINIKPDGNNLKLAKTFMEQGLPVSRESFETLHKLITELPEISPRKIVFLIANGLEPDEKNMSILEQIVEGKLKHGNLIQKLSNKIRQVLVQTPDHTEDNELLKTLVHDIEELPVSIRDVSCEEITDRSDLLKKQLIGKIVPGNLLPEQLDKLQTIRKHLNDIPPSLKEEILPIVDNLEKSIIFLKEASKQHYFYQIPLYFGEMAANGEIYILKNREGSRRFDRNGLSAFLSLDTENMGAVDAYINMTGKAIGIKFRADNPDTVEKISEYTADLYRILNDKGYKLTECSCKLKEADETVSILDAGEKVKEPWIFRGGPVDIKV